MEVLRSHIKLTVSLLIGSAVLACTCAAYDVEVRHMWGSLLQAVGFGPGPQDFVAHETVVTAGSELRVEGHTVTVTKVPSNALVQRLAWAQIHQKDGTVAFRGESLETVAAEFNQHNGPQLVIGDAATGHLLVGGTFHLDDLDGFLAALERTHGVKAILPHPKGRKPAVIVLMGGVSGSAWSDEGSRPVGPE
jgi:ferric-dicitrate binding protein FerR (iron transport regulator)